MKSLLSYLLICGCMQLTAQNITALINNNQPAHIKADSLDVMARKYMLNAKHDSAKILLDMATGLAVLSKKPAIIARCYIDYANMYNMRSMYTDAKKNLALAQPYLAVSNNYEVGIAALLLQAHIFNMTGKKDSAIYYYRSAENFNIEKHNAYRNYVVYLSLGEVYSQLKDYTEAEKNFDKAYHLTSKKEGQPHHGYVLLIYINYHLSSNKPAGAAHLIAAYDSLLVKRKKNGFDDPLKNVLLNLTGNRLENSISFMKEVREASISNKEPLNTAIADVYISRYYEKRKDYQAAIKYITEAAELAAVATSVTHMYETGKIKFVLLQKAGRYTDAAKQAETLFILKDSVLLLEKREQVYELEAKYETEKKQKEIQQLASQKQLSDKTIALLNSGKKLAAILLQQELLQNKSLAIENALMDSIVKSEKAYSITANSEKEKEKALSAALGRENKLKAIQLKKERNTKWMLAAGAGLLLLSGICILVLYKRQKNKNSIIQKQATDLEVLMKEIHHRVKNNLQIVSSLLDLQSHYITDAQASEAVKEGKNRVQSMALIHQNLYNEGNVKGIQVKDYVINLLQTLCSSYNISNERVKITARIDNLNLDVDTMIPLGLVINELVSNAFKYAFKNDHGGELEILLAAKAGSLQLKVKDNGIGFPAGLDVKNTKSFGLKMIRAFAQKLKAKLDIYNNNGAVVEMEILKFKQV